MNGLVAGNDGHMGLDDAKLNMQTINSLNIIACESVNQQQQKQQTKKKMMVQCCEMCDDNCRHIWENLKCM